MKVSCKEQRPIHHNIFVCLKCPVTQEVPCDYKHFLSLEFLYFENQLLIKNLENWSCKTTGSHFVSPLIMCSHNAIVPLSPKRVGRPAQVLERQYAALEKPWFVRKLRGKLKEIRLNICYWSVINGKYHFVFQACNCVEALSEKGDIMKLEEGLITLWANAGTHLRDDPT